MHSLRSIAEASGYSVTAVSCALRGKKNISAKARDQILAVAQAQGYQPDAKLAQLMYYLRSRDKRKGACNLAWLNSGDSASCWQDKPWISGNYTGALKRAEQYGYHLDNIWLNSPDFPRKRLATILKARCIEGVIITPPHWDAEMHASIKWEGLSVLELNMETRQVPVHRVSVDYFRNMRICLERIRGLGYRKPGLWISDFIDDRSERAYSSQFLSFQRDLPKNFVVPLVHNRADGSKEFKPWYERHRPDVVISAFGPFVDDVRSMGYRVPEDFGVVHLNVCADVAGWAGIDQRHEKIGETAVDMLVAMINRQEQGLPEAPRTNSVLGCWVDGWTLPKRR